LEIESTLSDLSRIYVAFGSHDEGSCKRCPSRMSQVLFLVTSYSGQTDMSIAEAIEKVGKTQGLLETDTG
jgi:hypothetical protein